MSDFEDMFDEDTSTVETKVIKPPKPITKVKSKKKKTTTSKKIVKPKISPLKVTGVGIPEFVTHAEIKAELSNFKEMNVELIRILHEEQTKIKELTFGTEEHLEIESEHGKRISVLENREPTGEHMTGLQLFQTIKGYVQPLIIDELAKKAKFMSVAKQRLNTVDKIEEYLLSISVKTPASRRRKETDATRQIGSQIKFRLKDLKNWLAVFEKLFQDEVLFVEE